MDNQMKSYKYDQKLHSIIYNQICKSDSIAPAHINITSLWLRLLKTLPAHFMAPFYCVCASASDATREMPNEDVFFQTARFLLKIEGTSILAVCSQKWFPHIPLIPLYRASILDSDTQVANCF